MPITATLDGFAYVIRFVLSGTLTLPEMTAAVDAVVKEVGSDGGYDVLSDHRALDTPATVAQLEGLVEYLRRRAKVIHGRKFAVVTASAASFGMMRMLSVLAQRIPMEVAVFQDIAEAEEWLSHRALPPS